MPDLQQGGTPAESAQEPAEREETNQSGTEGESKVEKEGGEPGGKPGGEQEPQQAPAATAKDAKEFTPEVRQRPWSNHQERAAFFKSQQQQKQPEQAGPGGADEPDDLDKRLEAILEKRLAPFQDTLQQQSDDREIAGFLSDPKNASFKPFEAMVRKAAPVYANVPINLLFKAFAFDEAQRLGAETATKVESKVTRSRVGGGTSTRTRPSGIPDFGSMTPAQIAEFNRKMPREGIKTEE